MSPGRRDRRGLASSRSVLGVRLPYSRGARLLGEGQPVAAVDLRPLGTPVARAGVGDGAAASLPFLVVFRRKPRLRISRFDGGPCRQAIAARRYVFLDVLDWSIVLRLRPAAAEAEPPAPGGSVRAPSAARRPAVEDRARSRCDARRPPARPSAGARRLAARRRRACRLPGSPGGRRPAASACGGRDRLAATAATARRRSAVANIAAERLGRTAPARARRRSPARHDESLPRVPDADAKSRPSSAAGRRPSTVRSRHCAPCRTPSGARPGYSDRCPKSLVFNTV